LRRDGPVGLRVAGLGSQSLRDLDAFVGVARLDLFGKAAADSLSLELGAFRGDLGVGRNESRQPSRPQRDADLEVRHAHERFFWRLRDVLEERLLELLDVDRPLGVERFDRVEPRLLPRFVSRVPPASSPCVAWPACSPT
jgi:hypothetical protein